MEIAISRTGHERYRVLCDESNPDHEVWRNRMYEMSSLPPLKKRFTNVTKAMARAAAAAVTAQPVWATPEVRADRWATCTACVELVDDKCRLCGCYFLAKISLATEKCPIGKW